MAKPNEKFAEALRALKRLQGKHNGVIESGDLKDAHRVILVEEGFLRQIMKGWYVCANPRDREGDSTCCRLRKCAGIWRSMKAVKTGSAMGPTGPIAR